MSGTFQKNFDSDSIQRSPDWIRRRIGGKIVSFYLGQSRNLERQGETLMERCGRITLVGVSVAALVFGCVGAPYVWAGADTLTAESASSSNAPADAQTSPSEANAKALTTSDTSPPTNETAATTASSAGPAAPEEVHKLVVQIEDLGQRLERLTKEQRKKWEDASAALPAFCNDWNRMLHDREVNNLSHLDWHNQQGYETATYTGYGQVEGCEAKESDEGIPIGKVRYEEMNYSLSGTSIDDAKSHRKLVGTTSTLEIFSYEKDRWFY